MVLTKKELDILFKKFKSVSNPKFEDIKYYSKDKLKEILEDVQINYVHENYRYFSDEADDIIRENADDEYKEYLTNLAHINNIFSLSKMITEYYITILNKLINNESINIEDKISDNDEIVKIKQIKEKAFLTTEEVSTIYQIKKDKLLELRTKKLLKYFQLEENGKVLFKKEDVDEFMKKNTF